MNVKAKTLKLKKTNYANSHGLSNPDNKSSAFDMAVLCEYCMQNETFRNIVKTEKYAGNIEMAKNSHNLQQIYVNSKRSLIEDLFARRSSLTE